MALPPAEQLLLLLVLPALFWGRGHGHQVLGRNILVFPAAGCFNLADLLKISSNLANRGHNITILLPDICVSDAITYLDVLASRADVALPAMPVLDGLQPVKPKILKRPHLVQYAGKEMEQLVHILDPPSMSLTLTRRLDFALSNCEAILMNVSLISQLRATCFSLALGDSLDFCFAPLSDALALSRVDYDALGTSTFHVMRMHAL